MRNVMKYFFEFDLETGKIAKSTSPHYAIRYYNSENCPMVEIGDGYRHELILEGKHWNRILQIIRDNELNKSGIEAITRGLMGHCLPEEYKSNLVSAIKAEIIKEIK